MVSRFFRSTGGAVALLLAGCAAPGPVPAPEPECWRVARVQSIPPAAWVELNGEAKGVAPFDLWVRTSPGGYPRWSVVRAHDRFTGAWEQKVYTGMDPWPEKILFDLRPYIQE